MFSINFHTMFYYIFIILTYNQKFSLGQYSEPEEKHRDNGIKITSEVVEEIVRKVCNISAETLARSTHEDKERLVNKIKEKLYKSAKNLPHGDAYVRMLMEGVRLVANKNTPTNSDVSVNTENKINQKPEGKSKSEMVKNIAKKVEIIANAVAKAKSDGDKKKAIQEIKKILDETARKKHKQFHGKHEQVNYYSDLITQGIEQAMQTASRRRESSEPYEIDIADNNLLVKGSEDDSRDISIVKQPEIERRPSKLNRLKPNTLLSDIKDYDCTEIRIHLCNNINALNVLQCPSDNTKLEISKLCDGVIDCTDNSDERDCTDKVSNIVHNATKLVMQIESSITLHCYPNSVEDEIMSKQNEVLRKVLEIQLKFITKHSRDNNSIDTGNAYILRSTINELVTVIDTLSVALKTTLCITPKNFRKFNAEEIINNEIGTEEKQEVAYEALAEPTHSLHKCVCLAGNCKGSSCSPDCIRFCKQKYRLGRWQCDAVGNGDSVAIDAICDGKLDCVDESDEEGCVDGFGFAKFEANTIFEDFQDIILAKIKSESKKLVRNKMISLSNFLKTLHAKITHRKPEIMDIKRIREHAFAALVEILQESSKVKTMDEIASLYNVLMYWNVRLVKALKRTHTGNDKIINSEGCFCSGNKCVQPDCSKVCIRACSSETILTRYFCEGSPLYEDSVPITAICNGTAECPGKDDESDCSKEGCRIHHLVVLRRKITIFGDNFRGTAVGEAIRAWKIKANASLKVVESGKGRPTFKTIREMIKVMLRDLVMSFASLDDHRRANADHVLDEYIRMSRILIDSLRSCGY